jgi:hypothetical protein
VCGRAASTYEEHVVTAAARPHVFWVGQNPATQERVRGWPVGPALLEMLGDLNSDVDEALADERARLNYYGYPEDLPLPALWWDPVRSAAGATDKPVLVAVGACDAAA